MFLRKLPALILIFISIWVTAIFAQSDDIWDSYPRNVQNRKFFQRFKWFYEQRIDSEREIPVRAVQRARAEVLLDKRLKGAGNVLDSPAQALTWQTVGPHSVDARIDHWQETAGRVRAIAVHPNDANIVYIGASAGGLWKTTDGGATWTEVGRDFQAITFGAIAIDPGNPETVYAGTGESRFAFGRHIHFGEGLYKSTDGGASFVKATNSFGGLTHFSALAVSPFDPDILFAALGSGYQFLGNVANEGIWVSTDGGATWIRELDLNDGFDVIPHPTRSGEVYAAIGGADDDSSGVWFSDDNGANWSQRNAGLPASNNIDRIHITLSPDASSTLYAVIYDLRFDASNNDVSTTTVYKSTDDAGTWLPVDPAYQFGTGSGDDYRDQGFYDLFITSNPGDADDVWVGNVEISRAQSGNQFSLISRNPAARNWRESPMHVDYHEMVFSQLNPMVGYVGCDGGVYRTFDGGVTFQSRNKGLNTLQFYRVASNPGRPQEIIGGAQDNGILANILAIPGAEQQWDEVSTGDGWECFFDPNNPDRVYASTQNLGLVRCDDGLVNFPTSSFGITNGIPEDERNNIFFAPFFMHKRQSNTLFAATTRLFRSDNRGEQWSALSTPIDSSNVIDASQSQPEPDNFIVSTANRSVFISTDGGKEWTDRSAGLPAFRPKIRVHASPHDDSTMFVVCGGFRAEQKIYKTTDLGQNWQNISGDLPNVHHSDLFVDPSIPNHLQLYAANDLGVYSSNDGGLHWERNSDGMPVVPAIDFDYIFSERLLRVATNGRGVYEADLPFVSMAVTAPNGGETFAVGATYEINWLSNGFSSPDFVRLEASADSGATWTLIAENVDNDGSYNWTVPNMPTNQGLIRVINPEDESISDQSNAAFTIFVDQRFELLSQSDFPHNANTFTKGSWGDYDNDGFPDLAMTSEHPVEANVVLLRNKRDGSFSNVTAAAGVSSNSQASGAMWGDYNDDGYLDLFVATIEPPNILFRNNADGGFNDVSDSALPQQLVSVTSAAWADVDRDLDLDLFVTTGAGERNMVFRQTTPGNFVHDFFDGEFDSRDCAFADYDLDGYPDLYVGNYDGPNLLYHNNGDGAFTQITTGFIVEDDEQTTSVNWGDFDGDGDFDMAVTNDGDGERTQLYTRDSNGFGKRSPDFALFLQGESKGGAWGDYDNDGDLDFFVANVGQNFLYQKNDNDLEFTPQPLHSVTTTDEHSNGASWVDFDNDGYLDLFIANGVVGTSELERSTLVRNKGNGNNWLKVKCIGNASNFAAIGAKVIIKYNQFGQPQMQIREISSKTSGGNLIAHFGLRTVGRVDSLIVDWPHPGVSRLADIDANQLITIYQRAEDLFVQTAGGELATSSGEMKATAWGDYDNDGFEDLFLVNNGGDNVLLRNRGDGSFEKVNSATSFDRGASTSASWVDYDNDGDLDLFVTNESDEPNFLYRNDGAPGFKLQLVTKGIVAEDKFNSTAHAWGDYDNNGLLDLFVADAKGPNQLYYNRGKEEFEAIKNSPIVEDDASASGCTWVDFDNDGDLDLFVTNRDDLSALYVNKGAPDFEFFRLESDDIVKDAKTTGTTWGDYDNDGYLDALVTSESSNFLYHNENGDHFRRVTSEQIVEDDAFSTSANWGDYNADGFLDLIVANLDEVNHLYNSNLAVGDGFFTRLQFSAVTFEEGDSYGPSWSDIDNDGDLDLVVVDNDAARAPALYRNGQNIGEQWLQVRLVGTQSNKSAIGAKVKAKAVLNSKNGQSVWQTRVVTAQSGAGGQNSLRVQFGLGPDAPKVDSLVVIWPGNKVQVLTDVAVGQLITIREEVETNFTAQDNEATQQELESNGVSWVDFDEDRDLDLLIVNGDGKPNSLFRNEAGEFKLVENSAIGRTGASSVAASWADANNDGLLDLFVANADEVNELYGNDRDRFRPIEDPVLTDKPFRATGCSWADFDLDGFVDLFVTNSDGENFLYRNRDFRFELVQAGKVSEDKDDSRGCAWGDYDNDGDPDLFVANDDAKNALYRNDGNDQFTRIEQPPFSQDVGLSHGASWGDYDNDGYLDLFVANQGQANFLYHNLGNGEFEKVENGPIVNDVFSAAGSAWADFDNDGDLDLFVSSGSDEVNRLYRNSGDGTFFRDIDTELQGKRVSATGAAWGDYDNDGALDLFVTSADGENSLYRNEGNSNNWVNIRCLGTISNAAGIGARVMAKANVDGRPLWQVREVSAQSGGGFSGQNSVNVEFGVGEAPAIDSLVIDWPSGIRQVLTNLDVNEFYKVEEEEPVTSVADRTPLPETFALFQNYPNPFNPSTNIRYQLPEGSHVRIAVYNMLGRQVAVLVDEPEQAGQHETIWRASGFASGIYVVRMEATGQVSGRQFFSTRKVLLLK